MANNRVGTLALLIDGRQYSLAGDFSINPGGPKRESLMGPDGSRATKETFEPATIEGDLRDTDTLDIPALKRIQNATITVLFANGKGGIFRNADQTGDCSLSTAEGTIAVKFEADSYTEI